MASQRCEGCGEDVQIGGGIAAIWSFRPEPTRGMTLVLQDDTEHFLCFSCIERLPEDATGADVAALSADAP